MPYPSFNKQVHNAYLGEVWDVTLVYAYTLRTRTTPDDEKWKK